MTPRDRFLALSKQDRLLWLEPAEDEFCAYGLEGASLNRILKRAGVSKGRTYHYFANKGELYRATLEARLPHIDESTLSVPLQATDARAFWLGISGLVEQVTTALNEDKSLAELVRILHHEVAAKRAFEEPLTRLQTQIEKFVGVGQSVGAIRDDVPHTLLTSVTLDLATTIDRWFANYAQDLSSEEETILSQRAFGMLIAPLLPPQQFPTHQSDRKNS
ncbi:transcriptional regulator, TetR family [Cohaesibacter sp. ES.047]|uniref:TetR/AcrR family transcriptional regulator n=1 Tax=Cohaesibacter sp. ES.047 TaxID=1798205 RepID=UPI000BB82073|nr:TetR/AcrR family transcriptional regulator [Cohaesibacter sp. ES.047]SNY93626.1 transcriptional regulator, TetR family [Cohaesibacter sp. ES.047]